MYSKQAEKDRRLKEKNAANTKKFMDERKNNMMKQNKKREKQKKTHETELDNISKYIKEVRSFINYSLNAPVHKTFYSYSMIFKFYKRLMKVFLFFLSTDHFIIEESKHLNRQS